MKYSLTQKLSNAYQSSKNIAGKINGSVQNTILAGAVGLETLMAPNQALAYEGEEVDFTTDLILPYMVPMIVGASLAFTSKLIDQRRYPKSKIAMYGPGVFASIWGFYGAFRYFLRHAPH